MGARVFWDPSSKADHRPRCRPPAKMPKTARPPRQSASRPVDWGCGRIVRCRASWKVPRLAERLVVTNGQDGGRNGSFCDLLTRGRELAPQTRQPSFSVENK